MIWFLVLLALESFVLTLVLSWLVIKLFPKIGLLDRPEKYGHKRKAIPYPTGIIFYVVFVLHLLALTPWDNKTLSFILGLTLLLGINFWDDRRGLPPVFRLCAQVLAALIMTLGGIGISVISNPLGGPPLQLDQYQWIFTISNTSYTLSLLSALFTLIWIVLFVNTLNWMDEPGIVSGISGISFLVLFILSLALSLRTQVGQEEIMNAQMVANLAIVGGAMCLAFLCFDFPPPRMLMGDSGSITLGCILAVLAIYAGGKIATMFLVLGFPVIDAIFVILRRLYHKKSPLKGDLEHFHHRLMRIGFGPRKTNLTIYLICLTFGILALFLGTQGKFFIILTMVVLSAMIEYLVMKKEKRLRQSVRSM